MMSSSKPLTQIQILQLEQNFSRAFSLGDSLNPDVVSAIYLIKNDQYVPVYGGNYYLNTSWRVRQMYQTHEDCNSARTLYTHYTIIGYAYMIVDFVDLNTMQPLGKIIVELNIDKLLSTLSLNQLYPSTVVIFSGAQGKRIGSLQTDLFRENEDMNKWYHASSSLRKSRERVDIYIPNAEILTGSLRATRKTCSTGSHRIPARIHWNPRCAAFSAVCCSPATMFTSRFAYCPAVRRFV